MGTDVRLVTHRTPRTRSLADVTVQTMILTPAGIVGQGPGICVAGIAGILLMANKTFRAIPRPLYAVGFLPPQVIMGGGLGHLMAFPAGLITMTNTANITRLSAQRPMATRPVLAMIRRRRFCIHIHVARGTVHSPAVRLLSDFQLHLARHLRDPGYFLVKKRPVAFRTAIRQGGTVRECATYRRAHLAGLIQGQVLQVLNLVAHSAGLFVNFLRFNPVFMALLAGGMRRGGKTALG